MFMAMKPLAFENAIRFLQMPEARVAETQRGDRARRE
jgi:hypothetical protein